MAGIIGGISKIAADLLFPPQCALCGAGGTLLCSACAEGLPRADGPRCDRCWEMVGHRGTCASCKRQPPCFTRVRAGFSLHDDARQLVHLLKYENLSSLADPMALLIASDEYVREGELVVPVPLHRSRERERGYNQAALLARRIAASAGLQVEEHASRRIKATQPLASGTSREERRTIVAGAFAAHPERVEGRRILLVDDVVTTGATLDACARALLDAGAAEVRCVTWARAD